MPDNVPVQARGLPDDHPAKIQVDQQPKLVERHPASANNPVPTSALFFVDHPAAESAKNPKTNPSGSWATGKEPWPKGAEFRAGSVMHPRPWRPGPGGS